MCDHNNVTNLHIDMLQASDGFTRYKCLICDNDVKKHVSKDIEFNRLYKKHHNLCIDHQTSILEIPTYQNMEWKTCCN